MNPYFDISTDVKKTNIILSYQPSDMIFLDEPTSGLDSHTARYLVSNLRDLARRGKIVLLTIHQPSSDIFHLFDQIGIMSKGEMVYCGAGRDMVDYFTKLGYPCDKYTNPLDRYGNDLKHILQHSVCNVISNWTLQTEFIPLQIST